MAIITDKPRHGHQAKLRVDNVRVSQYLSDINTDTTHTTAEVNPIGHEQVVYVSTGKTKSFNMSGWSWDDIADWEGVLDKWETPNEVHKIQFFPEGEVMPCESQYMEVIGTSLSENVPRDGVQTLELTGQLAGDKYRVNFTSANSDLDDGDWLYTLSNGHLELYQDRDTVSEPHVGEIQVNGLSADTKRVIIAYTLKAITGFGTPFMTENDSRWQLGWYDPARPVGQTFFEEITEYTHIANGNNFQHFIIAEPPTRLANNNLAFKFDLAPINTPDHQTYAWDIRKQITYAVI